MSKKKKGKDFSSLRCPYCGGTVSFRSAKGIYSEKYDDAMLCVCNNYPECDAYVKCHQGTRIPMGNLANKELREKRRVAHRLMSQLEKEDSTQKQDLYRWIRQISLDGNCHVGAMQDYACQQVIAECTKRLNAIRLIKERRLSK